MFEGRKDFMDRKVYRRKLFSPFLAHPRQVPTKYFKAFDALLFLFSSRLFFTSSIIEESAAITRTYALHLCSLLFLMLLCNMLACFEMYVFLNNYTMKHFVYDFDIVFPLFSSRWRYSLDLV